MTLKKKENPRLAPILDLICDRSQHFSRLWPEKEGKRRKEPRGKKKKEKDYGVPEKKEERRRKGERRMQAKKQ